MEVKSDKGGKGKTRILDIIFRGQGSKTKIRITAPVSSPINSKVSFLCTWQCLICDKDWETCSAPLVIAHAVQMGEPEMRDERGAILERRTTLDVGAQQRPLLARDTVTLVFVQWQCASAVEAARKQRVQDGQDVVADEAAAEGTSLAARRARERRLEAAGARIAHDVTVEALVNGRQADAPANGATDAVHDPLPLCHYHRRHGIRSHGHPKMGQNC